MRAGRRFRVGLHRRIAGKAASPVEAVLRGAARPGPVLSERMQRTVGVERDRVRRHGPTLLLPTAAREHPLGRRPRRDPQFASRDRVAAGARRRPRRDLPEVRVHAVAALDRRSVKVPMAGSVVLENAHVVEHDRVVVRSLAFAAGRIVDVPTEDALPVDLREHLIVPGLINAHDHLHLNNVPPLGHTEPFPNSYAWIDAFEPHFEDPDVVAATRVSRDARHWQGALKNLLAGVTTVAHHDPWLGVLSDPAFPVGLLQDFGWSHSLGLGTPRGDGASRYDAAPRYGPSVVQSFVATPDAHVWVIHLAEGTDDVAAGELARLDALDCLAAKTVLVHGVGLTGSDVERVIETGAAVVWCPSSNLEMLGRTIDPATLR